MLHIWHALYLATSMSCFPFCLWPCLHFRTYNARCGGRLVSTFINTLTLFTLLCVGNIWGQAQAVHIRVLITSARTVTIGVPNMPNNTSRSEHSDSEHSNAEYPSSKHLINTWKIGVSGKNLSLNGRPTKNDTLYFAPTKNSIVEIAGKKYRGGVFLRVHKNAVQAINVLDVEDYLRGVIAAEMPASWPSEALQAQAVIARSYAAARISSRAVYDTCATESCQVYNGIAAERPSTNAAITATKGAVVSYAGKVAKTYFASDSGGFTASSAEVWNNPAPYLIAQADPFSTAANGPKSQWTLRIPRSRVQTTAVRYGVHVGTLKSVRVTSKTPSGRPKTIQFVGTRNTQVIRGAEAGGFVRALGASSSLARLSGAALSNSKPLVITGYGNGHGVGLSQYGALGMAKKGYDHLHILGFYYPKTSLSSLASTTNAARLAYLDINLRHLTELPKISLSTPSQVSRSFIFRPSTSCFHVRATQVGL